MEEGGGGPLRMEWRTAGALVPTAAAGAGGCCGTLVVVPTAPVSQLRCLSRDHPAACAQCTPAPAAGDEDDVELVGSFGKKNGEKKLRSALTSTPEWNSSTQRHAASASCAQLGLERLAEALRNKTSSTMRKGCVPSALAGTCALRLAYLPGPLSPPCRDMVAIARLWGYKSEIWQPRQPRRRRTPAEVEAAMAAAAAAEDAPAAKRGRTSSPAASADATALQARLAKERAWSQTLEHALQEAGIELPARED